MSFIEYFKYLPENFIDVAEILSIEQLEALMKSLGGCNIYIPLPDCLERYKRDMRIRSDYSKNYSYRELARKYNLSTNTIRTIISRL